MPIYPFFKRSRSRPRSGGEDGLCSTLMALRAPRFQQPHNTNDWMLTRGSDVHVCGDSAVLINARVDNGVMLELWVGVQPC